MSTAVLELDSVIEVEPELKKRADVVFNQLGMSASKAVNLLLNYVVSLKSLPKDLGRPPIPCLEEMTEEEFDAMIQKGVEDIKAGRTYSIEDVRRILEEDYGKF